MRIGVLTSSRADFGIYLPLINQLNKDEYFTLSLIVFGTHVSEKHGYTIREILENGFEPKFVFEPISYGDSPTEIAKTISATFNQFDNFWSTNFKEFDLILCLGDRYEMFAAVSSGIPFGIKFAHIHGGETTLGAIDNIYRHSISLSSCIHFTAANEFSERVSCIIDHKENIFTVGSLSLDDVINSEILTENDFFDKWGVDLCLPTILFTFHPETIAFQEVENHSEQLLNTLIKLSQEFQIIITMPNADTYGMIIRNMINNKLKSKKNIFVFENLGKKSYFAAMKYCSLILGNSSSGIIEAASFNKFVIDIGDRQKGRLVSNNVLHANINLNEIMECVKKIALAEYKYMGVNLYYKENVVFNIINILKSIQK